MTTALLTDQTALAIDPTFIARCQAAASRQAITVAAEDPATTNHALRLRYAETFLWGPTQRAPGVASAAAAAATLTSSSTDTEILSAVATAWNALAGL